MSRGNGNSTAATATAQLLIDGTHLITSPPVPPHVSASVPAPLDPTPPHPLHPLHPPPFSHTFIEQAVKHYFPTFEASTGWRLQSSYDPIPDGLRLELVRFFAPYNKLLTTLLGNDAFERDWGASYIRASNVSSTSKYDRR
jgi:hypothetical protein